MEKSTKKLHTVGLIMLAMTAIFWGAGFVLNAQLQATSFVGAPAALNAARFIGSAIILLFIFIKKLRLNKRVLLFGVIGGICLFAGFQLQLVGLSYTTPAHCGFFTASYIVFVPFIAWITYRKRPEWIVFVGIGVAIVGFIILNINGQQDTAKNTLLGDALTLGSAIMFALQIVWSDYALKKDVDYSNLTFWQITFAGVLFVVYSLIFESKNYSIANFDFGYSWWRLLIVIFGGTAFAYYAQTYAQRLCTPTETSLILACESPIGAIISVIIGADTFSWTIVVGGLFVLAAIVLVEIVPMYLQKRKSNVTVDASCNQDDSVKTDDESQNE